MIVVPRLLHEQLKLLDATVQKRLALDFAEHTIQTCIDHAPPTFQAYVSAARSFLNEEAGVDAVAAQHLHFYESWPEYDPAHSVGQIVKLAVQVCCQRDLEQAGVLIRQRYVPHVTAVAKEAQVASGRWRVVSNTNDQEREIRRSESYLRWEEARWQFGRLIELVPNPHEDQGRPPS